MRPVPHVMEPVMQDAITSRRSATDRQSRRRLSTAALGTAAAALGIAGMAAPPAFAFFVSHFGTGAGAGQYYGHWHHLHYVRAYSSAGTYPKAGPCISGTCHLVTASAQSVLAQVVPNSTYAYGGVSYRTRAGHSASERYS